MPLGWVAGATAIAGLAGAAASSHAANQQADAAANAQGISQQQYQDTVSRNKPFVDAGYGATNALNQGLGLGKQNDAQDASGVGYGSLTAPFTTDNWKQLSPAYDFQLQQGQQGVRNGDSAGSGALSGSALKDLTDYNQSAANTSFNNAFNQYQTQQGNIFSRLSGIANLGQSSANNTAQQGTALAGQAAQSAQNIGTAQAGGTVGSANALTGSLSSIAGMYAGQYNPNNNSRNWDTENLSDIKDF